MYDYEWFDEWFDEWLMYELYDVWFDELFDADLETEIEKLKSFGDLILVYMYYDSKALLKIEAADTEYSEFTAANEVDCEKAIMRFEKIYNKCASWANGTYKSDKEKIQHFIKNCPPAIKKEYLSYVTAPGTRVNTRFQNYVSFKRILREVWETVETNNQLQTTLGITMESSIPMLPSVW